MDSVSKKIEGGIQSKYFSFEYRPSEDRSNQDLNRKCGSLIVSMAISDITGKKEHVEKVAKEFCEALTMCETEDELNHFDLFMSKLADIGGEARLFYDTFKDMINKNGKIDAQKYLQRLELKNQNKKGNLENKDSNKVTNFEKVYMNLNNEYEKFRRNPMVNSSNISLLIEMYQRLNSSLNEIKGMIDNETYMKYFIQISDRINNLRSISSLLDDLDKPMRR